MKSIISGKTEDDIYAVKTLINNLQEICDDKFKKLWDSVKEELDAKSIDVSRELIEDYLYDYVFNEKDPLLFEEYLGKYSSVLNELN